MKKLNALMNYAIALRICSSYEKERIDKSLTNYQLNGSPLEQMNTWNAIIFHKIGNYIGWKMLKSSLKNGSR